MTEKIDSDSVLFAVPEADDESEDEVDLSPFEDYSPIHEPDSSLFDVPDGEDSVSDIVRAVDGAVPVRDTDPLSNETKIEFDAEQEAEALGIIDSTDDQRESAE
ncbi:hypothetical protein [Natrinema versiforme]|uniref:Uncharacterized protein n=1 Tax=Natrinema versiforme JCM 10478 TaxID=1227496 RepID=L9Y449_9EURY|nr:hypothetical protein [Natrinema versiforme]ELY68859.1 hypothetical protein C489_05818 [Natrinema versiforme JCM 10478]